MVAEVDADILDDVQEKLRKVATGHGYAPLSSQEAQTLHNELARLRSKLRGVADWFRYHARSDGGFIAELLDHAPYDSPSSVPVTDGPTLVEIAAERDAAEQRASEQRQRAKEAEDVCVGLRSRVADLMRERDSLRATRRSALAQTFAAAMLAEHREDNLPWDEIMRRAFDAADVFLATEKETP